MFNNNIPAAFLQRRCYLLHFIDPTTGTSMPYKHARHYLGCADDLGARLASHRNGTGARLTQVVLSAGGSWVVARTWRGGRRMEKKLKGYHSGVKLCPICQGKITIEEVLTRQPAPSGRILGRRMPLLERQVKQVQPPAPTLDCAWCLQERGMPMGDGSHGICPRHAEQLLAGWRARRNS